MGREAFDEFYLREYPKVVGLLQGLLRSRLVAEDLGHLTQVPTPSASTAVPSPTGPVPARTVTSVPEQCIEAAELADEAISRLNRNVRDKRLFLALRDYTIASQACRREAAP